MIAEFVNDDNTVSRVWIKLTKDEIWQLRRAHFFALFVPWKCPAYFMGEELENIVCGYAPHRYVEIERYKL